MYKGTHTYSYNLKDKALSRRYANTLNFVNKQLTQPVNILDLGIDNPFQIC